MGKVVSVYDTPDKAKSALNVLKSSGIDTSDVRIRDRNTLGTGVDHQHVGLWRRLFGENVWEHEAAVYGDTLQRGGAVLAVRGPKERTAKIMAILDAHQPVDVHEHAEKVGADVPIGAKALVTAPGTATTHADKEEVLRLAEEQLNVGKRIVRDRHYARSAFCNRRACGSAGQSARRARKSGSAGRHRSKLHRGY